MSDPIVEAALRAMDNPEVEASWIDGGYDLAVTSAREAVWPIRVALDECAKATEPPCDFATQFNAYEKVIDKISGLVFAEEEMC